ncbi:hypothetical protein [Sphingopyxis sp.]|uniref:hypothetical protein n=1 Tax=Sphingopyxis sp. TaxID=1908224 RepID=UPI003F70DF5C
MSKAFRVIGKVAGIVATVGMFIPGPWTPIAATVAGVANTLAAVTAKSPPAKGQINESIIGANNPLPYLIGRSYSGGVQVWDTGYGPTTDKVANPYRFTPVIYSCAGPVQGLEAAQLEFETVSFSGAAALGYYAGFLYRSTQLGQSPEGAALAPQWSGAPGWGSAYKLSGFAAIGWSFKFDKKGKIFAQGVPQKGAIWLGVRVYDPRLDSTRPGGSGSHRIDNEATWAYSTNPALHALTYAYGRYQNGVRIFGVNLGDAGIDLAGAAAWANVCDANGWTLGGTIYEPGNKWDNLKRICEAGACVPMLTGGMLRWHYQAPRVALDTITRDDLNGPGRSVQIVQPWASRVNAMVARYRSEAHQWGYPQIDAVSVSAFVTADGEVKREERQFDLVLNADQASELLLYDLYGRRESGPFVIPCKPRLARYRPGDALTIAADCELWPTNRLAIVTKRGVDPLTNCPTIELISETTAKHAAILGTAGAVIDGPTLPTLDERAAVYAQNIDPAGYGLAMIQTSYISGVAGATLSSQDDGGSASISVLSHNRVYPDRTVAVTGAAPAFSGRTNDADHFIFYDDPDRAGGAVTFQVTTSAATAAASDANPDRHYVGYIRTAAVGGADTGGGGGSPPGWGGGGNDAPIP